MNTPQMTVEEIDFDPPVYGETPLADFMDQLRGIQAECPPNVIPMIKFNIIHRYDDTDIEATVYYPRLENQQEVVHRLRNEAREKETRRLLYTKLKQEFENEPQTGLSGLSGPPKQVDCARVHTSPLHLVRTV